MTTPAGVYSARHGEVRRLRMLVRDAAARRLEGVVVLEGPRVLDGALDRGAAVQAVYLGPHAEHAFPRLVARLEAAAIPWYSLREGALERIASTRTPQPVVAVARVPAVTVTEALVRPGPVVVCARLQDPGNVGTIVRSAEASGAAAVVLGPGSVDAYNPKVVRASAGAIFGVPVVQAESEGWSAVEAVTVLRNLGRACWGADAHGATRYFDLDLTAPVALVLGNEGAGLADDVLAVLDGTVAVPMASPAESLNVAMAATLMCFEAARQRATQV